MKKYFICIITIFVLSLFIMFFGCAKNNPSSPLPLTTPTIIATHTVSPTISNTFTITPTSSVTPTLTFTPTITMSATYTPSATQTATHTATQTSTPVCGYGFGNDLDNNDNSWTGGYILAHRYTAPSDFSVTSLRIKLDAACNYIAGVYSDVAGKPGHQITVTTVTAGIAGWNTAPLSMTASAGTKYWILIISDTSNTVLLFQSFTSPADSAYITSSWIDGLKFDMTSETWVFDGFDYNPNTSVYGCEL